MQAKKMNLPKRKKPIAIGKRQRQKARNRQATLLRTRQKKLPDLKQLLQFWASLKKIGRRPNPRARCEKKTQYYLEKFFSKEAQKSIVLLGFEPQEVDFAKTRNKIKNCSKPELMKMKQAIEKIKQENKKALEHVNRETMSIEKYSEGSQIEAGKIRHSLENDTRHLKMYLQWVEDEIKTRDTQLKS